LQIGDLVDRPDTYIYQDLSFSVLANLKNNDPKTFNYSGFKFDNDSLFNKRMQFQENIYHANTTIFTMSHWFQSFLQNEGKKKVIYVGGGINTPIDTNTSTKRAKKTILFIGRDFYRKGGKIVDEAFKLLYQNDTSVRLIIAGPETEPTECREVTGIQILRAVGYDTVAKLMKTASVFAMPSYFEAYGLVFLEAMANELPILVRDKFEMPYFVSRGSGLVITSGTEEFEIQQTAVSLNRILSDSSFQTKATECAKGIRNEFSWNTVASRILTQINNN
ncbi:glycosyltransferase, partial [Lactiplantibacillus garii]